MRHDDSDDTEIIRDGGRVRVGLMAMDSRQREVARHAAAYDGEVATDGIALDHHRPGYRVLDQAAQDRREAARDAYVRDLCNKWRSPQRVEQDTEAAVEKARDAVFARDDAQTIRDAAYRSYVARLERAWKGGAA